MEGDISGLAGRGNPPHWPTLHSLPQLLQLARHHLDEWFPHGSVKRLSAGAASRAIADTNVEKGRQQQIRTRQSGQLPSTSDRSRPRPGLNAGTRPRPKPNRYTEVTRKREF